ncbi:hypothetical protein C8J56DRAFT_910858 [Mycena floridula]|nr:hypothetical protein C8J56DRAFT_910858 [Mycena floridula]
MTTDNPEPLTAEALLESVEGEICFFKRSMATRPIGINNHFHLLSMWNTIKAQSGSALFPDHLWNKLESLYDMDALESIDHDADSYEPNSNNSTPKSIPSPSPSQNLSAHPYFRVEFSLPFEDYHELMTARRLRTTASPRTSPAESPPPSWTQKSGKRGKKSTNLLGQLEGGDSDSSALTQESAEDAEGRTPARESVVTGTDGGTEDVDEDVEMREASPEPSTRAAASKAGRSKASKPKKQSTVPVPVPGVKKNPRGRPRKIKRS